jgi:membrane-anchored protein YejM (alkaline phosphatase superfamily)
MELPLTPVQWGVAGTLLSIVVWVVYALLKGNIVSRRVVEDIRKDRDERLEQSFQIIESWKEAVSKRDAVIAEMLPTLNEIKDQSKTIVLLIDALKTAVNHHSVGGQDGS